MEQEEKSVTEYANRTKLLELKVMIQNDNHENVLSVAQSLGMSYSNLCNKLNGYVRMSVEEYDKILNYISKLT